MKQPDSVKDIAKNPGQPMAQIDQFKQIPLPPPFDKIDEEPEFAQISPTGTRTPFCQWPRSVWSSRPATD